MNPPAKGFGGKDSVKGNRQGSLSRRIKQLFETFLSFKKFSSLSKRLFRQAVSPREAGAYFPFVFCLRRRWIMAILKYIGRRLLVLIPVLLGISLAAFLLGRIAPGDPVDDTLFRIGIEFPTEEDRADMRAELGLDRPLPVQYLDWLGDALRGDRAAPTSAARTSPRS